jgi:hypothetical protein
VQYLPQTSAQNPCCACFLAGGMLIDFYTLDPVFIKNEKYEEDILADSTHRTYATNKYSTERPF